MDSMKNTMRSIITGSRSSLVVLVLVVTLSLLVTASITLAEGAVKENSRTEPSSEQSKIAYTTETSSAGFYNFDVDSPEYLNLVSSYIDTVWAGEFVTWVVSPTLYLINDDTTNLESLDPATGIATIIGSTGNEDTYGMAADPTSEMVYVVEVPICGISSNLYTINLATGGMILVGTITNSYCVLAIAFDDSGQLYGFDIITDSLIRIDKSNGNGTVVGATGFDAHFFGHGMDFEPVTGEMYLASYNNTNSTTELRTIDLSTGSSTLVGDLGVNSPGGQVQAGWMAFGDIPSGGDVDIFLPLLIKD
jgi:hypothetical protein